MQVQDIWVEAVLLPLLLMMIAVVVVEPIARNPQSKVIEVPKTGIEGNMCSQNIVNSPVNSAQLFPSGILQWHSISVSRTAESSSNSIKNCNSSCVCYSYQCIYITVYGKPRKNRTIAVVCSRVPLYILMVFYVLTVFIYVLCNVYCMHTYVRVYCVVSVVSRRQKSEQTHYQICIFLQGKF